MQFLNKKKKSHTLLISIGVALGIIVILGFFTRPFRSFFVGISKPFVRSATGVHDATHAVSTLGSSKREMLAEIESLQKEHDALVAHIADLEAQKTESEVWRTLFGGTFSLDSLIRAQIRSKPNQSPYDTFIFDTGEKDGIRPGAHILVNESATLGVVDSVDAHTAIGILYSSPGVKTVGRLERTSYDVTLEGKGGGNMIVEIPKEIETALGDRVLLPTYYNKVIGVIRDITLDDRNANKKLFITLPTNILTLDHVYIEK